MDFYNDGNDAVCSKQPMDEMETAVRINFARDPVYYDVRFSGNSRKGEIPWLRINLIHLFRESD